MKLIRNFFKLHLETLIVTLLVAGMTLANSWHIIYRYFTRPEDKVYIGITHYHEDYFYYLSQVTQGAQGSWKVANLYTTEPLPSQFLWWPNILLGKITMVTGLPVYTVYSLSVIVTAAASLIFVYLFIRRLYPNDRLRRIGAFTIATVTSTFYQIAKSPDGALTVTPYQFFYNYTGSLNRLGGVFHLILQNILSIIMILGAAVIFENVFEKKHAPKKFLSAVFVTALSAFLLALINPVYILVNGSAIVISTLILTVTKWPGIRSLARLGAVCLIIAIVLALPVLAMQTALKEPYFQYFRWWETNIKRVIPEEFFQSMGPLAVLAVIGLIPFLKKFTPLRLLGVVWTVFPLTIYFTLIPIKYQFPFFRLPQPPQYAVFGALAAEAFYLAPAILSRFGKKQLGITIFILLITTWSLVQLPAIRLEIASRNSNSALTSWLNYLHPEIFPAMQYLKNSPDRRPVLSINNTELIIPAFSGRRVYEGHHSITMNYAEKIAATARFFNRSMSADEAGRFITQNNIGPIVWRNPDSDPLLLVKAYPFLKPVFSNSQITVFEAVL